jgi:hypothetical protein
LAEQYGVFSFWRKSTHHFNFEVGLEQTTHSLSVVSFDIVRGDAGGFIYSNCELNDFVGHIVQDLHRLPGKVMDFLMAKGLPNSVQYIPVSAGEFQRFQLASHHVDFGIDPQRILPTTRVTKILFTHHSQSSFSR